MIDSTRLVTKKQPARIPVVRVSILVEPRVVMKPPPPPMPRPPPSERCSSTSPIMASTIMRWTTIKTVCMPKPGRGGARERLD